MSKLFNHPNLLCAEEVAKILGMKTSTISKWVYEKKIPIVKFGPGKKSLVRFDPSRLNEWIQEKSLEPQSDSKLNKRENKKASKSTVLRFTEFVKDM